MAARLSVDALRAELANSSADASAAALNKLRGALRLHAADLGEYAAAHVAVTDERLHLARQLCEAQPPLVPLILDAWEVAEQRTLPTLRPVPMQVLAQILDLLSVHQPYHALGEKIIEELLAPTNAWLGRMHGYIAAATQARREKREGSSDTIAALVALKLLTAMAAFARGKLAQSVWERFHWSADVHARLLSMRRRARAGALVSLHDADIRTQYLLFLGAMLAQPFHASLKTALLDLGGEGLPVVFKGMYNDPAEVVQYVLLILHEELFKDTAVPRGAKARLMSEHACASLLRLYTREQDTIGENTSVADLVHHFFLSIATHPGFGICYQDRGWYPKLEEEQGGPVVYNKVLAHLVKQLAPVDDLRQQELALRILAACPELVAGYLQSAQRTLTLEPKAESAWLGSMAFVGRVLALPVPLATPNATPPPMATVLANTAPEMLLRALGRGLRHADALVQYFACLVIARALQRVEHVERAARRTSLHFDEPHDGAWTEARRTLELAWRKRFPSVDAVAQLVAETGSMRQEAALRVLALYHTALPSMTFDTRYDAGKLLSSAFLETTAKGPLHLERLCQLHALQIVSRTTEAAYDFAAKAQSAWPGCALRSNLHFLLALYSQTDGAVRRRAAALLHSQLGGSALFAHDPAELHAWLAALPRNDAAVPSVLNFWDECMQRCLKTPYRYAERARALVAQTLPNAPEEACPSPLLMVLMEQAAIRLEKGLFGTHGGADANASEPIVQYIVRLVVRLVAERKPYAALAALLSELRGGDAPTAKALAAGTALLHAAAVAPSTSAAAPAADDAWALDPTTQNLWAAKHAHGALAVLHSRWADYAALPGAVGSDWRMFWAVLLQRLENADAPAVETTLDALDQWAATYELSPFDLRIYLVEHPVVAALLEQRTAASAALRVRLVELVSRMAAGRASYAPCLAPLVENVVAHLAEDTSDVRLLHSARALAGAAHPAAHTALVRTLLEALRTPGDARSAQLACLAAYAKEPNAESHALLQRALPTLVELLDDAAGVRLLHRVLCSALPAGLDGAAPPTSGSMQALRALQEHRIPFEPIVRMASDADAVLMRCVYAVPSGFRDVQAAWGSTADAVRRYPCTTLAVLELTHAAREPVPAALVDALLATAAEVVGPHAVARCLAMALLPRSAHDALAAKLMPVLALTPELVWLVAELGMPALQDALTAVALRQVVHQYADEASDGLRTRRAVRAFTALVLRTQRADAALADPVLEAVVAYRAGDLDGVRLALALVRTVPLRAASAARALNGLVTRTELLSSVRAPADAAAAALRSALVSLLVALARQAPDAVQAPTTLARLLYLYTGTLSASDRALFSLFQAHERQTGQSLLDVLGAWSADQALVPSSLQRDTLLAALLSLDAQRTHAACVQFPRRAKAAAGDASAYDPWLVLNLVGGAMLEREAGESHLTGLEWLAVLRTGAIGVVVCALSAHRAPLRLFALGLLGKVYASIGQATFRERDLVLLILDRVRDVIPPPPPTSITGRYEEVPWLPTMATLFVAHCLRAVAAPQLTLFPVFCRFLLQRPKLDVADVPLLYNLLHSSSDQLHHERSWLLRFLDDALAAHARLADSSAPEARRRTRADWRVFQRRHVWDLLLSLYDALSDGALAHAQANTHAEARDQARLESIFACAARIPYLGATLVTRRGFLQWIAMRVASERATRTPERSAYWLQLMSDVVGVHLDAPLRVAHMESMDRLLDGALPVQILGTVDDALCDDAAPAQTALRLVHAVLEYASLRTSAYTTAEGRLAARLVGRLRAYATDATLSAALLSAALYAAPLGAPLALPLDLARHPRSYAPRRWALAAWVGPCASRG